MCANCSWAGLGWAGLGWAGLGWAPSGAVLLHLAVPLVPMHAAHWQYACDVASCTPAAIVRGQERCMSYAACCMLHVARRVLRVACCVMHVTLRRAHEPDVMIAPVSAEQTISPTLSSGHAKGILDSEPYEYT